MTATAGVLRGRSVPAEELHRMARETMHAHFLVLRSKGGTRVRTPEEFYGFRAEDVIEMYFHKRGVGRGVWYRLNDGRVIDAFAEPSQPERAWYVASAH